MNETELHTKFTAAVDYVNQYNHPLPADLLLNCTLTIKLPIKTSTILGAKPR